MKPRVCRCCGEPMVEGGNALSRNPNVCASCSSMADGMEETNLPPETAPALEVVGEVPPAPAPLPPTRQALPGSRPELVREFN